MEGKKLNSARKIRARVAFAAGLAIAASTLSGTPAHADPRAEPDSLAQANVSPLGVDGNQTGSTISPDDYEVPQDVQVQAKAKEAGIPEWWTVEPGEIPALGRLAARKRVDPTVASKNLPVTHNAQQNGYYCGPATGRMILKIVAPGPSNFDGTAGTQSGVANYAHMQTDFAGATRWEWDQFRRGVNRWWYGSTDGFYVNTGAPTVSQFKNALKTDIENTNVPFAADTVEWAGGAHYNGHPVGSEIGHWITVSGFSGYGGTTRFHDPSTSIWGTAAPVFSASTGTFVNTYLQQNGITW